MDCTAMQLLLEECSLKPHSLLQNTFALNCKSRMNSCCTFQDVQSVRLGHAHTCLLKQKQGTRQSATTGEVWSCQVLVDRYIAIDGIETARLNATCKSVHSLLSQKSQTRMSDLSCLLSKPCLCGFRCFSLLQVDLHCHFDQMRVIY